MKIGIKYCGGCNPQYDRKIVLDILSRELENAYVFEIAKQETTYEYILIVCGCVRTCAVCDNLKAKYSKIFSASENDYLKVIKLLKEHSDKKCEG